MTKYGLLLLLLLVGCAPVEEKIGSRFFWPPPPHAAKIEYRTYYATDGDMLRGVDRRLEAAVLGLKDASRIIFQPYSVASDGKGRVFVVDFSVPQVLVLDLPGHTHRHLQGTDGIAQKVLVDGVGDIWVLDSRKARIYHFGSDEVLKTNFELKDMERPASFAVDAQRMRLYVVDAATHQIRVLDYGGEPLSVYGKRGSEPGEFNYPTDLDLDRDGNLYIIDSMNARVQVLTPEGAFVRAFGERGTASGSFAVPKGIAVSPSDLVYVTDASQNKIVIFNTVGDYLLTLGGRYVYDGSNIRPGGFYYPAGIDVDSAEQIWIADLLNGMVHEFQYLTPEYLAVHPIKPEQIYAPKPSDLVRVEEVEPARPTPTRDLDVVRPAPPKNSAPR